MNLRLKKKSLLTPSKGFTVLGINKKSNSVLDALLVKKIVKASPKKKVVHYGTAVKASVYRGTLK